MMRKNPEAYSFWSGVIVGQKREREEKKQELRYQALIPLPIQMSGFNY